MRNLILLLAMAAGLAASQPDAGHFHYELTPKLVAPGESVVFHCHKYGSSQHGYTSTWEKLPTGISFKKTYILKVKAIQSGIGLPATGYSGPRIVFNFSEPARYIIQWDSAGDFKEDLGDTASFEVIQGLSVAGRPAARPLVKPWLWSWHGSPRRIDGRRDD